MQKNEIWRSYGTDYKEMTRRLLLKSGLAGLLPDHTEHDPLIAIKPNLVTPAPACFGGTTHPEIIAGIIEFLQERGYRNIVIAEGSWVGDETREAFEYCGYNALARQYGITLIDMQQEKGSVIDCAGEMLSVCDCVREWDYLINVPVLKGHCQTNITCALKNLKGLIPNTEKRRFHTMGLHTPIAHLNAGIRPDFIVIDHICGDLSFEEGGDPVTRNCIMTAVDPVLVDSFVCSLLGYETEDVPYIGMSEALGVGSSDLSELRLITCEGEPYEDLPSHSILDVSYAVDEVDSCSACYGVLLPALRRLKEEGLLEKLHDRIAIGQGHRGKTGPLGVGNCTAGFDICVRGCPPAEEDIYKQLKEVICEYHG
ncbi:MAG: DUF362 domain-containing protein [Mogibacterium sp.]|nr:DUF362 domain-containing protein [Mogibacterium sp.]